MLTDATRQKWRTRTDWLIEQQDKLTDWELGFIEKMDILLDREMDLTIRESFKLGEIFKRIDEGRS